MSQTLATTPSAREPRDVDQDDVDVDQTGNPPCGSLEGARRFRRPLRVLAAVAGFCAGYLLVWRVLGRRGARGPVSRC